MHNRVGRGSLRSRIIAAFFIPAAIILSTAALLVLAMPPSGSQRGLLLLLLALGAILPTLIVATVVSRAMRTVNELTSAAQRVASGHAAAVRVTSGDEIAELADQFNAMSTELLTSYRTLQEREERLELVLQATNDGLWDWDLKTNEVYFSPRWKSMLGYEEDEIKNEFAEWQRLTHPDDAAHALAEALAYAAGETPAYRLEHRLRHKDGSYRWVLAEATLVRDADGRPCRMVGSHTDITERKQAEAALQQRLAFENLITSISTEFINLPPERVDAGIQHALEMIGRFSDTDRAYVFMFAGDYRTLHNTHEWCAPGITPQIAQLRDVPEERLRWLTRQVLDGQAVYVPDMSALPPAARSDGTRLRPEEVKSFIVVPMSYQGNVLGFMGLDSVRQARAWPEESISMLKIVGEIIINALEHKRSQAIQQGQRHFLELLATGGTLRETLHTLVQVIEEQSPGMWGLILLLDEDGKHLHIGAAPSLPEDYVSSIEGLEIGADVGSCGTAAYSGERVIVTDIQTDRRWEGLRDLAVQYGLRACWSQPVFSTEGQVLGTFAMYYRQPRAPTEDELRLIETAAHLVGIALEHERTRQTLQQAYDTLEQRVEERTCELSTLLDVSHNVASMLDLEPLLGVILDQLRAVLEYHGASIFALESDVLRLIAYRGPLSQQEALRIRFSLNDALVNREAIEQRAPLIVADTHGTNREARLFQESAGDEINSTYAYISSWLGVPLVVKDRVIGMLTLDHSQPNYYTAEHARLAMAFAHQVAVAIENARSFAAEQHRAEQFRVISEVGRQITSVLDVDELLRAIVNAITATFGFHLVGIALVEGDELVIRAAAGSLWDDSYFPLMPRLKVGQDGIMGWVAASGEAVLANDVNKDPHFVRVAGSMETRSELVVPLKAQSGIIGVLNVESQDLNAFDESDLVVLQSLANQAAIAIENARLFQAEGRRAEQFRAISEVGRRITSILSVNDLLWEIARLVKETLHYYLVGIALIEDGELAFKAGAGAVWELPDFVPPRIKIGREGITGWVAEHGEPMLVPDVQQNPWYYVLPEASEIRSELAVPLKVKERVIGVLHVQSAQLNAFDESDVTVLQSLAQQASIAIENARLYEQAQEVATLEERQRLARELHDSVTQALYGVTLYAEAATRTLSRGDADRAMEHLQIMRETAQEALREMRLLIFELRPPLLEQEGLVQALRARLEAVEGRAGLQVRLDTEGEIHLPSPIEKELYRIAQETLNNVLKHAQAQSVNVRLAQDADAVTLVVMDDGVGFDTGISRRGMGLPGIEERVRLLSGTLELDSALGRGTRVRVSIPLAREEGMGEA